MSTNPLDPVILGSLGQDMVFQKRIVFESKEIMYHSSEFWCIVVEIHTKTGKCKHQHPFLISCYTHALLCEAVSPKPHMRAFSTPRIP